MISPPASPRLKILPLLLALAAFAYWFIQPVQAFYELRPHATFTYTLDDPYIHMSIAKNLVQHGVWGVIPGQFTSSDSSLLYPLLLALVYALFGVSDLAPLWINILVSILAVYFGWRILERVIGDPEKPLYRILKQGIVFLGIVGLVYFTPLAPEALSGMETNLQICLALAFADAALPVILSKGNRLTRSQMAYLFITGLLFATVRYEDLALIALVCLALLWTRHWRTGLVLGVLAVAPALIYGMISVAHGWLFLPNPILVKSFVNARGLSDPESLLINRLKSLFTNPEAFHLGMLLIAGVVSFGVEIFARSKARAGFALVCLLLPAVLAQGLFGQIGWFYRYEAYLVAFGVIALAALWGGWVLNLPEYISFRGKIVFWARLGVVILVGIGVYNALEIRALSAQHDTPGAMTNIYDQQIQMSHFLKLYYAGSCVVINDIGAISYQGEVCIIDLAGLATRETANATLAREPLKPVMQALAQRENAPIAMIYDAWYWGQIPRDWQPVGTWTLDKRVIAGAQTVTFYAIDPEESASFRQHFIEYSKNLLPKEETWAEK